jgi:hypothetical protein
MSEPSTHQDLLSEWQRMMQQGLDAWQAISTPQAAAAAQIWQQAVGQGLETWMRAGQQDAGGADALLRWKQLMDASVETWSKSLDQALASPAAAAYMGQALEQFLNAVGPLRKSTQTLCEDLLRAANLPSRKQVTRLAAGVVAVDERVEALDERLDAIEAQLQRILARLEAGAGPEQADRPAGPAEAAAGGPAKRRPQKGVQS